jgi:photosystem II stability/assembly factor-like uncharacterized protein
MRNKALVLISLVLLFGCKEINYSFEFQELDTPSKSSLRAIHALDEQLVWASGSRGQVLLTLDGGENWKQITVPGCEETEFRSLHAWDEKRALVFDISPRGRAFMTSDGGASWEQVYSSPREGAFFNSVKFSDNAHGIAISDPVDNQVFILRTMDGGKNWERIISSPPAEEGEINFAASNTCIEYLQSGEIFIVSGGKRARILSSPDHGEHWQYVETPTMTGASAGLFSVEFIDSRRGVAVGGDFNDPLREGVRAIYTEDGGKHWYRSEQMPAAYRSCVISLGGNMVFATGKTGCDYSSDAGMNWTFIDSLGYYAASRVDGKSMIYLSGSQGRIARVKFRKD